MSGARAQVTALDNRGDLAHHIYGAEHFEPTLSEETRSAVSSRVNWLIWSTMVAILGLVETAASVDSHLLWMKDVEGRRELRTRMERAQVRAAILHGDDMVAGWDGLNCGIQYATGSDTLGT